MDVRTPRLSSLRRRWHDRADVSARDVDVDGIVLGCLWRKRPVFRRACQWSGDGMADVRAWKRGHRQQRRRRRCGGVAGSVASVFESRDGSHVGCACGCRMGACCAAITERKGPPLRERGGIGGRSHLADSPESLLARVDAGGALAAVGKEAGRAHQIRHRYGARAVCHHGAEHLSLWRSSYIRLWDAAGVVWLRGAAGQRAQLCRLARADADAAGFPRGYSAVRHAVRSSAARTGCLRASCCLRFSR